MAAFKQHLVRHEFSAAVLNKLHRVVAAVNEALKAASDKSQSQMSAITGGIGGGLGGLL